MKYQPELTKYLHKDKFNSFEHNMTTTTLSSFTTIHHRNHRHLQSPPPPPSSLTTTATVTVVTYNHCHRRRRHLQPPPPSSLTTTATTTVVIYNHRHRHQCKEQMRAVKKSLNQLKSPDNSVDIISTARTNLLKVGDHIASLLCEYKEPSKIKQWRGWVVLVVGKGLIGEVCV